MPNRILKESICTSATIDELSAEEERLFYRLLVKCDDHGRYHAHPSIVRSNCFPRKDDVSRDSVSDWMDKLENVGLIERYQDEKGELFLRMVTWLEHQQVRAASSKFPEPPLTGEQLSVPDDACEQLISDDIGCEQMSSLSDIRNTYTVNDTRNPVKTKTRARETDEAKETIDTLFAYYKQRIQPAVRLCPSDKIILRLKRWTVDELKQGIDNFAEDEWWMKNCSSRGADWFFYSDKRSEQFLLMRKRNVVAMRPSKYASRTYTADAR